MEVVTQRQSWMATLAKASLEPLEQAVSLLENLPTYQFLRPPEIGLVMVKGRAGGTGQPFFLGEMTLSRCVVQLGSSDEKATIGFGYVAGRSLRHAELAALCDALLQHSDWYNRVYNTVIVPLQTDRQKQQEQQQRQTEATRVSFFTMVRGDSLG